MGLRYELFKIQEGTPIWVGCANTIQEIKAQVQQLGSDVAECLIFDQLTGHKSVFSPEQVAQKR
jgi:hypothetical protein